jgi:Glycosyltransferase like family
MIAFGSAIVEPRAYERWAEPGIRRAAEPDSPVLAYRAQRSLFRSYNLVLDRAAAHDDLEALVLLHQDTEIVDPEFCAKVRRVLSDPEVGVIGVIGAIGVRSIAWWEGSVTWASFIHRSSEHGGVDLPGFAWDADKRPAYARTGEVDVVDGFLMVLSPWVVRNVRFDESLGRLHGYDVDFCFEVRARGRKVVTADLRVIHHHSLELVSDPEGWVEAHMRVAEKWDGRVPGIGGEGDQWKERARRAEAESELARATVRSQQLRHEASDREVIESISWRITSPLRRLNRLRRQARARLTRDGR